MKLESDINAFSLFLFLYQSQRTAGSPWNSPMRVHSSSWGWKSRMAAVWPPLTSQGGCFIIAGAGRLPVGPLRWGWGLAGMGAVVMSGFSVWLCGSFPWCGQRADFSWSACLPYLSLLPSCQLLCTSSGLFEETKPVVMLLFRVPAGLLLFTFRVFCFLKIWCPGSLPVLVGGLERVHLLHLVSEPKARSIVFN